MEAKGDALVAVRGGDRTTFAGPPRDALEADVLQEGKLEEEAGAVFANIGPASDPG